jgi:hypothetical protein
MRNRIPILFKLILSCFCAVLVPVYWRDYGPTNFLYFCDVALILTLIGVWRESALLISAPAVGILVPQGLWALDFLSCAAGFPLVGMTGYMFSPNLPLFTRGLSFFHFWLPFVLVWLIWRLGYDRHAVVIWTGIAWVLLVICYFLLPGPPALASNPALPVNVNYVFGLSDAGPQKWMPSPVWFALLMAGLPTLIFYPTHRLLCRFAPSNQVDPQELRSTGFCSLV